MILKLAKQVFMKILGIESSCDDTAAAVVTANRKIVSNVVWSQIKEHMPYGGVVPEIAARAHMQVIETVIEQALYEAECDLEEIDLIAATGGPGLIGGVMVAVMVAKSISLVTGKPFIAVNHLAGHALTVRLTDNIDFPYLLLLISGGHCQWLVVNGANEYQLLGATLDDALGEAFDKTAKMLGLGYPGGPQIEQMAKCGDENRFTLPRPLSGDSSCNFSFSGLKTAVRLLIEQQRDAQNKISDKDKNDICASFQKAAADCITSRCKNAIKIYELLNSNKDGAAIKKQLVVAGGVAANRYIKDRLEKVADNHGYSLVIPPAKLCTDNAAMIAWAGYEHYCLGVLSDLAFEPRARWPLSD